MSSRVLHTPSELVEWMGHLGEQGFPMTVSFTDGAVRSNPQNRTIHMWFGEIAKQTHESTDQVKRECKFYQGCPILMEDDPQFVAFINNLSGLTVEQKIAAMDYVAVTSIMTTPQMQRMCDAVHRKYAAQGIRLTDPELRKYEAAQ